VVEVNLERDPAAALCFVDNDPLATLRRLEAYTGEPIAPDERNLLFLDEIQASPELFPKLRWLAEEVPELPVIAAGSLLDFALADRAISVPVGRISYMHVEPLGFEEFLLAMDEERLASALREEMEPEKVAGGKAVPEPLHERLLGLFREFLLVGGMPAVVDRYRQSRSLLDIAPLHQDLLATLREDFAKYADRVHHRRLSSVLASVPQQIGSRFRYSRADRDERAVVLRNAVDLLCLARICHRVQSSPAIGVPLGAGVDERSYKLLLLDVGLAGTALGVSLEGLEREPELTLANQGAMAEQVVGQLLRLTHPPHEQPALYYWQRESRTSQAEVDYVIQQGTRIVPIEVKAGATGGLKSLHVLMAERGWDRAVRLNSERPSVVPVSVRTTTGQKADYTLVSLPLYATEHVCRVLGS
jgi:hypothetical protein